MDNPAKTSRQQLGKFQLQNVSGGRFVMDGGTMFGVVPQVLWRRHVSPNDNNCVPQASNCLLVQDDHSKILIDTGYGGKLSEKQRCYLEAESGEPIRHNLGRLGVRPEEIDLVILSHLHFDHAGGATFRVDCGQLQPTFSNAEYIVQRREWELAVTQLPELEGVYDLENLMPLKDAGQLRLVDGQTELYPGIDVIHTGGHTPGHQAVRIQNGDTAAIYLGDLCPSSHHLPVRWNTAYDLDVLETRTQKKRLLSAIADRHWWAWFDHDIDAPCARLRRDDRHDFVVEDACERE